MQAYLVSLNIELVIISSLVRWPFLQSGKVGHDIGVGDSSMVQLASQGLKGGNSVHQHDVGCTEVFSQDILVVRELAIKISQALSCRQG